MNRFWRHRSLFVLLGLGLAFRLVLALVIYPGQGLSSDLGFSKHDRDANVHRIGFVARVLTGPTLSPLGQLVTRVITPRLGLAERPVPGPPKRFAQGMGAVFSVAASILALGFGLRGAAYILMGLLVVAASLEAFAGYCLGCRVFALLMRAGIIPESVCEECADLWSRAPRAVKG